MSSKLIFGSADWIILILFSIIIFSNDDATTLLTTSFSKSLPNLDFIIL
jgi:hypothetical protein